MNERLIISRNGMEYDFTSYTDYNDIGGHFGFIGPDGSFYKVRSLYDDASDRPHNTWAREYIKFYNLSYDSTIGTASTALVKKYGFILYTCYNEWNRSGEELFILPEYDGIYNAEKCETKCKNQSQLATIRKIVQSNLENEINNRKKR